MMYIPSDLANPRYSLSKMALFTATKTEHRQAGEKVQSTSRLFTGSDADEITARCQPDVRFHPILERGCLSNAIFHSNSHDMAKEVDNISFPCPLHSFSVPDGSTRLVRVWASVS